MCWVTGPGCPNWQRPSTAWMRSPPPAGVTTSSSPPPPHCTGSDTGRGLPISSSSCLVTCWAVVDSSSWHVATASPLLSHGWAGPWRSWDRPMSPTGHGANDASISPWPVATSRGHSVRRCCAPHRPMRLPLARSVSHCCADSSRTPGVPGGRGVGVASAAARYPCIPCAIAVRHSARVGTANRCCTP